VQDGLVSGLQDLERFLAAYLKGQVARSDALIVKLTFEAAGRNDVGGCVRLDEKLYAMRRSGSAERAADGSDGRS